MATIFLSYKRDDAGRVRVIIEALRAEGFDVWWDQGVGSGEEWRRTIREQIATARVVSAVWSHGSIVSDWVIEEAEEGKKRRALCPVLIDPVSPPLGFGGIQASNLTGWRGNRSDPAWRHYADSLRAIAFGLPPLERRPPKPRSPLLPIIGGVLGVTAALLSVSVTLEQGSVIDLIPGWPTGPDAEGAATAAEAAEWASVLQSRDCARIAAYLRREPDGVFASEAQALLAAKQAVVEAVWEPFRQPGWTTGSSSAESRHSREAACASAQQTALRHATSSCSVYDSDGAHRQTVAVMEPAECDCTNHAIDVGIGEPTPSWTCSVRAPTTCSGEVQRQVRSETCGS